ncbi:MAG: hypothetical protein ACK56I_10215, partial [bacterium]
RCPAPHLVAAPGRISVCACDPDHRLFCGTLATVHATLVPMGGASRASKAGCAILHVGLTGTPWVGPRLRHRRSLRANLRI